MFSHVETSAQLLKVRLSPGTFQEEADLVVLKCRCGLWDSCKVAAVAYVPSDCTGNRDSRSHGHCAEFRTVGDWEHTGVRLGRVREGNVHHRRKERAECHRAKSF